MGVLEAAVSARSSDTCARLAEDGPPTRSAGWTALIARALALYSGTYADGYGMPHISFHTSNHQPETTPRP